jgi:spore coat protein JB
MDLNREKLLEEVMAADFYLVELNLYLDTHPCDQNAINLLNQSIQRARMIRDNYERFYGPLTALNSFSKYPYQWIESPWPWEKQ